MCTLDPWSLLGKFLPCLKKANKQNKQINRAREMAQRLRESTCYSCRSLRFGSQHSHGGSQPFVITVPEDLMSSSSSVGTIHAHRTHIHMQAKAFMHKKQNKWVFTKLKRKKKSLNSSPENPCVSYPKIRNKRTCVPWCNNSLLFFHKRIHPGHEHGLRRHDPDTNVFRHVQLILFCNDSGCTKGVPFTTGSALTSSSQALPNF